MATTTSSTTSPYFASDSAFRTACSEIHTAIEAVNIVQTADTGQINWGTATRAGAAYTAIGYEMFRFNDSLQSTSPVYIRLDYGSTNRTDFLGMWLTVGTDRKSVV